MHLQPYLIKHCQLVGLIMLLIASLHSLANDRVVSIGVYDNPPKILLNAEGQVSGLFGDLIREIAIRENWTLKPVACQWDECLKLLDEGQIDLMPDVAKTAEREERMNFHQQPVLHSWSQVFAHKNTSIRSVLDLDQMRVAVLAGSVQQRYLTQLANEFDLTIDWKIIQGFHQGLELINEGQADALATNNLFGSFHANQYNLEPTAIIFQPAQLYFTAPLNNDNTYLERIDFWITQWIDDADSPYQQVLQGWQTQKTVFVIPTAFWIASVVLIVLLALALLILKRMSHEVHSTRNELQINDKKLANMVETQKQEVHQLSFYDHLTELPNRRLFMDRLQTLLISLRSEPAMGAVMLVDIDNFRSLNDTLGHQLGDQLLTQFAKRLTLHLDKNVSLSRFGGDEFMLILENLSSDTHQVLTEVEEMIETLKTALEEPFHLDVHEVSASLSIGIVLFSEKNQDANELIQHAELAVFDAKKGGRQQVKFFDKEMQQQAEQRTQTEFGLRQALKNDELLLFYQAQYRDNQLTGAEVLIRWQPLDGNLISPAEFIPVAEASGLILPIGYRILQQACEQLVKWSANPKTSDLILAVNISAVQIHDKDFINQVVKLLQETGAPADHLEFELTESMLIDNVEEAIIKINQLKELGIRFSLDDFGTGYSSLSMLTRFPLDTLKVDQSFVRDMHKDIRAFNVVKTVIELGRSLNLNVIAEGVETNEQRNSLTELGCQNFQGYLFAKPCPIEEFTQEQKLIP
ncbi:MAG: EAL domain-containing protein [Oceanospirillales bacterium]|nr:MAG: EAL domain-containing protein [Oceanospirillales bacterium]